MKNILVTGGAGYIGSNLVDFLLNSGDFVTVIDNLSTGKMENINHNLDNSNFKFIKGDILNEELVEKLVKESERVYHLAAAVGVKNILQNPLEGILTNVKGTENLLKHAFKYNKRIVIASTSEIYGKSAKTPFSEDDDRILGSTKIHRWSYSTAKAIDEHLAFAYFDKGLQVSIVRYFNSYGSRIDSKGYGSVIAQFIRQGLKGAPITVHGSGDQTRCFTYIADTISGTIAAMEKNEAIGEVFNIGNDVELSILELAKLIKKKLKSNSEIACIDPQAYYGKNFEDTKHRKPSIDKARNMLGFYPKVSLEEGLNNTIIWCKNNYRKAEKNEIIR
ncbi:hypothetical protein A3J90_06460 [candidate division WOR-1 bacterium RIFOXYC2_FULL_37_10]|uniref:UDP-glucuronate decarboxylase n=1 Tax=candidate division WOR-1 bacterium RIFOXYB2_FULL_37_13 TaxID=1802579 RepID=A0A1F4SQA6_UNCSA|nr:MAG: hypothetical protein A2310_07490 [candidate division WOR-1 bacterium RIFOXYB2_FULL_37_13]OGC33347.1 MAG: hypothetical protein A3J90_06460 [candidate division WOR-1 bacterium RIFOXYC2_FULL_37_10]